jgi:ATP-binding cassette subfamily B protein
MSITQLGINLFKRYPALFAGNLALALLLMAIDAAALASLAPVVNILSQGGGTDSMSPLVTSLIGSLGFPNTIEVFLTLFVLVSILSSAMLILINYCIVRSQYVVRHDMVWQTTELILYSSANFINRHRQGEFMNTLTQEVARVADAFTSLTRLIAPFCQSLILLAVPLYISWEVTAVSMGAAFLLIFPLRWYRKRSYTLGQAFTKFSNDFSSALHETLQNVRLIAGFANEKSSLSRVDSVFSRLREAGIKSQVVQFSLYQIYTPIGTVIVFITFLYGQWSGLLLADIAVILFAFNRLAGTFANLSQAKAQLMNVYASYEQVSAIQDQARNERLQFGATPCEGLTDGIHLDNVSFKYSESTPAIDEIDLTIPAGKMTALVGSSGAGKSTIVDLVMGMQQPNTGAIRIDGVRMNELDIESYRRLIGYVPQQSSLFNMSIRDNIKWANADASEADILEACKLANADKFISELDDGFDTIVGDRGVRLSGGQIQRIALARALVRKPVLLILDEATSALDSESEQSIRASIEELSGRITILAIAHRLSTVSRADVIYTLDKGRVIERGTFDELMERDGTFSKLAKLQNL